MFTKKISSKWIIIAIAVFIIGIIFMKSMTGGISAEVFKASKGEIKEYVEETAEVQSQEKQTVYVEGSGKVVNINVDTGDTVKQGDLLLSLDKTELNLQLKDAEAKIAASKAQLKGTDLVNYANKIELAKNELDQAQVSYDSSKRNYDNAKNLYDSQAISKAEFETAQDEFKQAQVSLKIKKLELSDLNQGTPDYIKSGYKAQLEQAVINRDTILENMKKQDLRAQMDGVIIERLVEKNTLAAPSQAAFVLGNVNHLELEADILEDDINKIKIGNSVDISGKPIGESVLKGKVTKIAPAAETIVSNLGVNQKRVPVTIEIIDSSSLLKPGYNMDVKIMTDVKTGIVKVPDTSVFDYKGKSNVFIVSKGKAQLREVIKGIESDDFIEIKEGVKDGEIVLVNPDNNIKEGSAIKPLEEEQ